MKINLKAAPFNLNDKQIQWVEQTLSSLTIEKKIGQLFHLVTYTSDPHYLDYLVKDLGIGGCMMRTMSLEELAKTVNYMQEQAPIPLLLSANIEAGTESVCSEGTRFGTEMASAACHDVKLYEKVCRAIGEETSALGINYAFAPIIDIDYNWENPITNTRTYGSDPKTVSKLGAVYVKEMQSFDLVTSIKHFPGDGCDSRDQHLVGSINTKSADEWMDTYGQAYKAGIEAGALSVMTGHILQPAWSKRLNPSLKDEEILPGLASKELLNGLLRKKLGFNGMIISDSSTMAGLNVQLPRKIAVPTVIAAGCDMFLFTKNLEEDFQYMKEGLESGILTKERLDEAVMRILAVKAKIKLPEKKADGSIYVDIANARKIISNPEHKELAQRVADESITLVKEEKGVLPLDNKKYPRVLVYGLNGAEPKINVYRNVAKIGETVVEEFNKRGYKASLFSPKPGFEGMVDPVTAITDNYDLIVYAASYQTKSNQTTVRIEWSEPFGANVPVYLHSVPTIFISFENPYHLIDVPRVRTYINTYGFSKAVLESLFEKLEGKASFQGVSPVDAFCGRWDTHLS
ncbi:MAG: glycoside hydrolase family 3 protein [Bacilli bacterium]|jgi:beta-N-acetylhexosaminidase|nr:glycoside hydrolase family 3 protein [Bacilli bacterium]